VYNSSLQQANTFYSELPEFNKINLSSANFLNSRNQIYGVTNYASSNARLKTQSEKNGKLKVIKINGLHLDKLSLYLFPVSVSCLFALGIYLLWIYRFRARAPAPKDRKVNSFSRFTSHIHTRYPEKITYFSTFVFRPLRKLSFSFGSCMAIKYLCWDKNSLRLLVRRRGEGIKKNTSERLVNYSQKNV